MSRLKLLTLIILLLIAPLALKGQGGNTTVTATVSDPSGNLYTNSQVNVTFVGSGQPAGVIPLLDGSTFQTSFTGYGTDSFGNFTFSLPDTGVIDSSSGTTNSQWRFSICYSNRSTCFAYTTPINCLGNIPVTCTSNSMNISVPLKAAAAPLPVTTNPASLTANNAFTGNNTFTIINSARIVSPSNPQGWSGSDLGAWVNAAFASCISAGTGCPVQIAAGSYSFSTPIVITQPGSITCPGGPDATVLTYTPATGDALTVNNSNTSFVFDGCKLATSTSTSSRGIVMKFVNQALLTDFHINGFNGGGTYITGDGVSNHSLGVRINRGLTDGYCGSGSYGMNMDHTVDVVVSDWESYTTTNCATATASLILDTGVGGLWGTSSTHEQGISGLLIRNTNQNGSYGGSPGAIFFNGYTIADTNPGGSGVIFDSTLGTNSVRFFCSECWVALAGRNASGSVITASAIGVDIEGGSGINFDGGTFRGAASWGAKVNSSGTEFSFTGVHVVGNNQSNTAGVGGILVTANPGRVTITGNISGNNANDGGNQAYGLDASAVTSSQYVMWSGNDFSHNVADRIKLPTGLGSTAHDAPDFGGITGVNIHGAAYMDIGPLASGTQAVLSGTGACATLSAQHGGSWGGEVTCTGTTGVATLVITPGSTAPTHWQCSGSDTTHTLAGSQSGLSTTTCTLNFSSVTANDVLTFTATAY